MKNEMPDRAQEYGPMIVPKPVALTVAFPVLLAHLMSLCFGFACHEPPHELWVMIQGSDISKCTRWVMSGSLILPTVIILVLRRSFSKLSSCAPSLFWYHCRILRTFAGAERLLEAPVPTSQMYRTVALYRACGAEGAWGLG